MQAPLLRARSPPLRARFEVSWCASSDMENRRTALHHRSRATDKRIENITSGLQWNPWQELGEYIPTPTPISGKKWGPFWWEIVFRFPHLSHVKQQLVPLLASWAFLVSSTGTYKAVWW